MAHGLVMFRACEGKQEILRFMKIRPFIGRRIRIVGRLHVNQPEES